MPVDAPAFTRKLSVFCPRCGGDLSHESMPEGLIRCPLCRNSFEVVKFDAPERIVTVERMETAGPEGAQSCARHEGNAAVANCRRCGAFMCDLCKIDIEGRSLCPDCFNRLRETGELDTTSTTVRDWTRAAGIAVVIGFFIWPFMSIAGLLGAGFAVADFFRKNRAVGSGYVMTVLTLLLALAELVAGVLIWASLFAGVRGGF